MPDYWSASELASRSDAEIIDYIRQFHDANAGQAEMERRLMASMNRSARRLELLTVVLVLLTVVLVVLTIVLVVDAGGS
jgi:hypothetical protein